MDKKNPTKRTIISEDEVEIQKRLEKFERVKSIPSKIWKKIEEWGRETDNLSTVQKNTAWNLMTKVRNNSNLLPGEVSYGISILDIVIAKSPELLFDADELSEPIATVKTEEPEITLDLVKKWCSGTKHTKD